jgi:hypothetical protein
LQLPQNIPAQRRKADGKLAHIMQGEEEDQELRQDSPWQPRQTFQPVAQRAVQTQQRTADGRDVEAMVDKKVMDIRFSASRTRLAPISEVAFIDRRHAGIQPSTAAPLSHEAAIPPEKALPFSVGDGRGHSQNHHFFNGLQQNHKDVHHKQCASGSSP